MLFEFETPLLHPCPFLAYLRSAARCQREVPTPLQPLIQIILRLGPGLVENRARSADPFALLPRKRIPEAGGLHPWLRILHKTTWQGAKNNAAITQKHMVLREGSKNLEIKDIT